MEKDQSASRANAYFVPVVRSHMSKFENVEQHSPDEIADLSRHSFRRFNLSPVFA